jgi:hypothetical protein
MGKEKNQKFYFFSSVLYQIKGVGLYFFINVYYPQLNKTVSLVVIKALALRSNTVNSW